MLGPGAELVEVLEAELFLRDLFLPPATGLPSQGPAARRKGGGGRCCDKRCGEGGRVMEVVDRFEPHSKHPNSRKRKT